MLSGPTVSRAASPAPVDLGAPHGTRLFLRSRSDGDFWPTVVGAGFVLFVVFAFWFFATGVTPDIWVPALVYLALHAISIPVCVKVAGRDTRLRRILIIAFLVKMACVFPRYAISEYVYGGESDAQQYRDGGIVFYDNVKHGEWSIEGSLIDKFPDETRSVGYATGILFLAVGTTFMGGYMIFTWLSWVGLLLFFRAFRVAFPNAPPYRCAYLIFFLPSALYWPSALGKDALMIFALGVLTSGLARLLTPRRPLLGVFPAVAGGYIVAMVRPHLLAIALVGVAVSFLARNASRRVTKGTIAVRVLLLVLLIPGLFFVLGRLDHAFGNESGTVKVTQVLEQTDKQTSIGGSSFQTQPVRSPIDLPIALFSVIFRPFLFEAGSLPVAISALEGTALLVLTVIGARWIWRVGPAMYRHPFAAYCGAYVVAFVIAFSNVGNAGILARQRVQMFPILMLLVAAAHEHYRVADPDGLLAEGELRPEDDAFGIRPDLLDTTPAFDPDDLPLFVGERAHAISPDVPLSLPPHRSLT